MKKKGLIIIILSVILLVGIIHFVKINDVENSCDVKRENFSVGYTLDDGRILFLAYSPSYKNEDKTLGDAIFDGTMSVDEVTSKLDYVDSLQDGGSKLYKYNKINKIFGTEDFYMLTCDSLDGIRDIYIAQLTKSFEGKCRLKIDDLEGVSMAIKEGTLTKSGATVVITDISFRQNVYGNCYYLEKEENGIWVELVPKKDLVFNSMGYFVGEDHILELEVNWEYVYGKLDSGKYRIVKGTSEPAEGTEHYITAEFVIE